MGTGTIKGTSALKIKHFQQCLLAINSLSRHFSLKKQTPNLWGFIIERVSKTFDQLLKIIYLHAANINCTLLYEIHNGDGKSTSHLEDFKARSKEWKWLSVGKSRTKETERGKSRMLWPVVIFSSFHCCPLNTLKNSYDYSLKAGKSQGLVCFEKPL